MKINRITAAVMAGALVLSTGSFIMPNAGESSIITAYADDTAAGTMLSGASGISYAKVYTSNAAESFNINGRTYYQGITFTASSSSYTSSVVLDVKDISKLSWTMGHIDNASTSSATLKIYLDGVLKDSIQLESTMLAEKYEDLDVSGASELKLTVSRSGSCGYAIADISADGDTPAIPYKTPSYEKVSDFIGSGVDEEYLTYYLGKDKTSFFNMNGRKYYQGINFNGTSASYTSTATFNVENVKKLSWTIGHVDNAGGSSAKMNVYFDNVLCDTIDLSNDMELYAYDTTVPEGSQVMRITVTRNGNASYAIADMKIDDLEVGVTNDVPEFSKISTFIESGFNKGYVSNYTGSSKANSFIVNGRTYYNGIVFNTTSASYDGTVTYNVENLSKIKFSVGRVCDSGAANTTLHVYLDNVEQEVIKLTPYMNIRDYEYDLTDAKNLRFVADSDGKCLYALMNITVDELKTENDFVKPVYDKAAQFIDKMFNYTNCTGYNGTAKANSFKMNGRTYYEGVVSSSSNSNDISTVSFNVENANKISWTMGHIDNAGTGEATLYVYKDGAEAGSYSLFWDMPLQTEELDVSDANVVRFYIKNGGKNSYGLADIKVDGLEPANAYSVPKYDSTKTFIKSGFTPGNAVTITGEAEQAESFKMNDVEYNNGVKFSAVSSYYSYIMFNAENLDSLNFKLGHLDSNTAKASGKLTVYKDGKASESFQLSPDMDTKDVTIDTKDTQFILLHISDVTGSYNTNYAYAIADIKLNEGTVATTTAVTTTKTTTTTTTAKTTAKTSATTVKTSATTAKTTAKTTVSTTAVTTTTVPVTTKKFGDINGDDKIDARDASLILAFYAFSSTEGGKDTTLEDFVASGK